MPGCAVADTEWAVGPGVGRAAAASVREEAEPEPEPAAATPTQAPEPRTTTVRLASSRFRPPSRRGRACLRRPSPAGLAPARWKSAGSGAVSTYAPVPSRSRPAGVRRITAFWGAETAGERRLTSRVAGSRLSSMCGTVRGDGRVRSASRAGRRAVRSQWRRTPGHGEVARSLVGCPRNIPDVADRCGGPDQRSCPERTAGGRPGDGQPAAREAVVSASRSTAARAVLTSVTTAKARAGPWCPRLP